MEPVRRLAPSQPQALKCLGWSLHAPDGGQCKPTRFHLPLPEPHGYSTTCRKGLYAHAHFHIRTCNYAQHAGCPPCTGLSGRMLPQNCPKAYRTNRPVRSAVREWNCVPFRLIHRPGGTFQGTVVSKASTTQFSQYTKSSPLPPPAAATPTSGHTSLAFSTNHDACHAQRCALRSSPVSDAHPQWWTGDGRSPA